MINKTLQGLIESREFISLASCDLAGRPNAAPKFLLKVEGACLYLVDYIMGQTFRNVKVNPRVSLSFFDNSDNQIFEFFVEQKYTKLDNP